MARKIVRDAERAAGHGPGAGHLRRLYGLVGSRPDHEACLHHAGPIGWSARILVHHLQDDVAEPSGRSRRRTGVAAEGEGRPAAAGGAGVRVVDRVHRELGLGTR